MSLMRWEPFHDLWDLQRSINRLFEDSFLARRRGVFGDWFVPIDVEETDDSIIVKAEAPGMDKDSFDIRLVGDQLTIRGERKEDRTTEKGNVLRSERTYGAFARTITLPASVKADQVTANYRHGVLEITLPKAEDVKPRQIKVDVRDVH